MDKKELIDALDKELKLEGFQKRSTTWYLDEEKIVKVVNLQKSNFSDLYYLNLSIFLKGLGKDQFPKEEHCHIRTRLDNTIVNLAKDYDYLFDMENVKNNKGDFQNEIKDCVQKNILPQLEAIKTKEGVLKVAEKNPAMLNMLPLKVKEYYGI